jgi:thiamine biosynthesis lipoprotein
MASPCELLVETDDAELARDLVDLAATEAWRIEKKFSRYRQDNIIHQINNAQGNAVTVDDETAKLLDFSAHCYEISNGLFDVTSGILCKAWHFDRSDRLPEPVAVEQLLQHVGWHKLQWRNPQLIMPDGMQLDFGGIGKEYATDKVLGILMQHCVLPLLVNFGGDLHCSGPRRFQQPWSTGIENPLQKGHAVNTLQLYRGALATSGNTFRYLQKDGKRYSHILNPKTGWPDTESPRSVTVAAENCTEAGILATLAMLHGREAEQFLEAQQVRYWIFR